MLKKILACLLLVLGFGAFFIAVKYGQQIAEIITYKDPAPIQDNFTPRVSEETSTSEKKISILFIGNSFTSTNDLPGMLLKIASSDPANRIRFEVMSETKDSAHLDEIWKKGEASKLIKKHHFDFVVLQEQSTWPFLPQSIQEAYIGFGLWVDAARKAGATPALFETWADKEGSPLYKDHGLATTEGYDKLASYSRELAGHFGIAVIPVGDFWNYALSRVQCPDLYQPDYHHPNAAGTYLAALLFYRSFTSTKPDRVTFVPEGVTLENANLLRDVASQ